MPTVDSTVGGANSNSYLTVEEADAYWEAHLYADAWNDTDKEAAVIWATRVMDASFVWTGQAATATQALGWPREGMYTRNGFPIANDVIPVDLKNATAELAGQLAASNLTETNEAARAGLTKLKVGPVELGWTDRAASSIALLNAQLKAKLPEFQYAMIPDAVRALIPPSWYERVLLISNSIIFEADR